MSTSLTSARSSSLQGFDFAKAQQLLEAAQSIGDARAMRDQAAGLEALGKRSKAPRPAGPLRFSARRPRVPRYPRAHAR